jgi:catechol 2,3-dioxygenase-like lactoylglutathione lyase family enzyme
MDFKLELVAVPVSDVDRAKAFYQGLQLVVADINAAHAELAGRGVDVSDVQSFPWGDFVFFQDPDGNGWAVQAIPARD